MSGRARIRAWQHSLPSPKLGVVGNPQTPEPQAPPDQLPLWIGPRDCNDQNETLTPGQGLRAVTCTPCSGSIHRGQHTLKVDLGLAQAREPPHVPGQDLSLLSFLEEGWRRRGWAGLGVGVLSVSLLTPPGRVIPQEPRH